VAGKGATLAIRIVSDAKGASSGFAEAETRVQRFESGLNRASAASAGVLAGLAVAAKGAFDAASAFEQSTGAIETVFGTYADRIKAVSEDAAGSVGLSASAYQEMAATMGAQLQNMGMDQDAASKQTSRLVQYGADLAATFGGSTADAVSALGSLLRGEADPIERYGISIKAADIEARLAAQGLGELEGAERQQAETAAMMSLLTEQAGGALGAFSREAGTAAGSTQIAQARFEDAQAALGQVLLPIVAAAAEQFASFTTFLVENQGVIIPLIAVIAGLAAGVIAVNAALSVYRAIQTVVTAAQWLFNAALMANPLGLIIAAIAIVIGAVVLMYNKFGWFRDLMDGIKSFLGTVFDGIMSAISWVVDKLSWIGDAASWVGDLFSAPMAVSVTGGGPMLGAPVGAAGIYGAGGGSLSGGTSPSAGQGSAGMIVNVTVNGALDPVGVGRQLEKVLRNYGRATGRQVSMVMGAR
jgi:hypothetical protein